VQLVLRQIIEKTLTLTLSLTQQGRGDGSEVAVVKRTVSQYWQHSEFEIPRVGGVFFTDEALQPFVGKLAESDVGIPCPFHGIFDHVRLQMQVREKVFMGAVATVLWLFGWHVQRLFHEVQIEIEQEGTVKEQEAVAATL